MKKATVHQARHFLKLLAAAESYIALERSRRIATVDMSVAQAQILLILHSHGPMSLVDLNGYLATEIPPSRVVNVLVERQLVDRQDQATDRRRVTLTLTRDGKQRVKTIIRIERALERWVAKKLSADAVQSGQKALAALCVD